MELWWICALCVICVGLVECGRRETLMKKAEEAAQKFDVKDCRRVVLSCEQDKKNIDVWFNAYMKCGIKYAKKEEQSKAISDMKKEKEQLVNDITECGQVKKCDKDKTADYVKEFRALDKELRSCKDYDDSLEDVWEMFSNVQRMLDGKRVKCAQLGEVHLKAFTEEQEIYRDFMKRYWDAKIKCA